MVKTTRRFHSERNDGVFMTTEVEYDVGDHIKVLHPTGGELKTKQEMAADCDINTIMGRWLERGIAPGLNSTQASYGDFSSAEDLHSSINRVMEAQDQFDRLPAEVRKACDNSPVKFIELCGDESRIDELKKLGLVEESLPPFVRILREEKAFEGGPGDGQDAGTVG